jgi:rhamnosyltransferase
VRQDHDVDVAVLLPTYNGARFVESQIRSLKENHTSFTLHWLDDHSTDNTREVVRACAKNLGIRLREWHQSQHLGWQVTFFQLLECAEADIYLFCDQDDIWQAGKIDATVANLSPDVASPTLCFSHAFQFRDGAPAHVRQTRVYDTIGIEIESAVRKEKIFTFGPAQGNTMGFTRPLRDMFLSHGQIARKYAAAPDWWMYILANASGACRFLANIPTTLYRVHANNSCGMYSGVHIGWKGITHALERWRFQHRYRYVIAHQAAGFCLASPMLPQGPQSKKLLKIAKLVSTLNQRQSLASLARLARLGAMPPSVTWSAWLSGACLSGTATDAYILSSEREREIQC